MYYKTLQKLPWSIECPVFITANAMTVRIFFTHDEFEGETEFCIKAWGVRALADLFEIFCQENHYTKVTITDVCVVRCAKTLDALTEMEENLS